MMLDSQKYREALSNLGPESAVFVEPPIHFREWLNEKRLPTELANFLVSNAIRDELPFPTGCGGMWTAQEIMELNDQEPAILGGGLFAVGNAINGDFIVLDLAEGAHGAGFVSHDELWEGPPRPVREFYVAVSESIHEMLAGISSELRAWIAGSRTGSNFPIDYCSALERTQSQ